MKVSSVAPCQCHSPGMTTAMSPGPTSRRSSAVATKPWPAVTWRICPAAWVWGNPFNGTVFSALFLFLFALASRLSKDPVHFGTPILAIPGAMLVAFGWAYPHFLETDRWTTYAYAAPLGVLPCPTLSAVIGATLIFRLLGSATWSITLVAAGFVYGAIGVFILAVRLDYVLLGGALVLVGALRTLPAPKLNSNKATASA